MIMSDCAAGGREPVLTDREWAALCAYDTWVEADVGGTSSSVRTFVILGAVTMILIAVALLWRAGDSGSAEPDPGQSVAVTAPQEEKPGAGASVLDRAGGFVLVYRVKGDPTPTELDEIKDVLRKRLEALDLEYGTVTAEGDPPTIRVELPGLAAMLATQIRRTIATFGPLNFAIEASEEELTDPKTGLGATFDSSRFVEQQEHAANARSREAPDRFPPDAYTGELVHLYKNPEDFTRPAHGGEKPVFTYYPPHRWQSRKTGPAGAPVWKGPAHGAIVHMRPEMCFSGDKIGKVYPTMASFEAVVGFDIKPQFKEEFRELSRRNIKRNLCVVFDEKLVTNPVIQSVLPGSGIIQGIGEREQVRNLVITLKSGQLPCRLELVSQREIRPRSR